MVTVPGRQDELLLLGSACRAALDGTGQLVLLTGEAGIGKSRLAQAAEDEAIRLTMSAVRAWCVDDPGAPPLWPWYRVARHVPGLSEAFDLVRGTGVEDGAQLRLAEAVAVALADAARGSGLTVVLEDLHWADPLSLDVLRRLLPEVTSMPVLLVATARDNGLEQSPYGRAVSELLRAPATVHLPLSGLSVDAVRTWMAADPRTTPWVAHADDLVRRTAGNPFYIKTLTRELPRPGSDVWSTLTERPTWRAVLAEAYRTLPATARETVATAAVLGERLAPALLADALNLPLQAVGDHLGAAVRSGILHSEPTGLAFNHALVRDAIVAELGPAERTRAHARIAAALERTGDHLLAGPAAVHWSRVDGPAAAARCRDLAACAAAAELLVPDRGVELARLALESARSLNAPAGELAERLVVMARFEWAAGMLTSTLRSCATGLDLAERARRPDLMADFALVPQGVGSSDVAQIVGAMCRRALACLPEPDIGRRARLLALCAVAAVDAAQAPRHQTPGTTDPTPVDLSAEALAVARASADQQAELEAIAAHHYVLSYPQAIDERSELADRAVELADSATTSMGALWGHLWQADLAFQRGDLVDVQRATSDVRLTADGRSSPVGHWHALRLQAALNALTGRFAAARDDARRARKLAERVDDISMIGMHYAFHVQLGLLRGDPDELLPDALDILEKAPPLPLVRVSLTLIRALQGDLAGARAAFAALRDAPARMPLGPRWAGTVGQIGLGAVLVVDEEVAHECYRLLRPTARWCGGDGGGSPFATGSNEYHLGRLAQTFGDPILAAEHFARGIVVDDRIGARPFAAVGRLGLAECLDRSAGVRSRQLAREAADELRRLDMPGPLAAAVLLSERADPAPGLPAGPYGRLSGREVEVVRLVGRALSNQQIAGLLYVSVRTVESHVRSALAKLGLSSRTQIAVWLHEQDRGRRD